MQIRRAPLTCRASLDPERKNLFLFGAGSRYESASLRRQFISCMDVDALLGEWRDSLGICICVGRIPGQNKLDVYFSQPDGDPYPLRKSITSFASGGFKCGHYEVCVDASSHRHIVWVDCRNHSMISVWERQWTKRMVSSADSTSITEPSVSHPVDVNNLISALSAAFPELSFDGHTDADGCGEQQCERTTERTMIVDAPVRNSNELKLEPMVSPTRRWDHTQHPLPPWRTPSGSCMPASDTSVICMHLAIQAKPGKDSGAKHLFSHDLLQINASDRSVVVAPLVLAEHASETHPWDEMKKRKYREKHIAAYGVALLGKFHSLDIPHTSTAAATRSPAECVNTTPEGRSGMSCWSRHRRKRPRVGEVVKVS